MPEKAERDRDFNLVALGESSDLLKMKSGVCKVMNVNQGLIQVFEIMQASRMGLYVHEGMVNGRNLRELIT